MLPLLILFLVLFSFLPIIFPRYTKIFFMFAVFIVMAGYLFLETNFFHKENFLPTEQIYLCPIHEMYYSLDTSQGIKSFSSCYNYYNMLVDSLKEKRFCLDYGVFLTENVDDIIKNFFQDTSLYNNKIYLYFGITPVLLFYLPFNLITGLYLSDKLLVFVLGCFSFLLSLFLTFKLSRTAEQPFMCVFYRLLQLAPVFVDKKFHI